MDVRHTFLVDALTLFSSQLFDTGSFVSSLIISPVFSTRKLSYNGKYACTIIRTFSMSASAKLKLEFILRILRLSGNTEVLTGMPV
jgi:hypothetical protein